ncbi:tpa, zn2cys6 transcription factor [Trichoderma arundinaceum]|uniref:Tpa, zn2cys6 transcription factor n=1 Tax=Trichoderma arundinaceum TaxID=490622 RepID=A0A395NKU2_TRIAR|nr:tpa, zn2cys6 transcription factor [Trichoderma arundinaceum]
MRKIFENWGKKILTAVEEQGRLLSSLAEAGKNGLQQRPDQFPRPSDMDGDNLETMSRKDTPWTPITGSDMILSWSVFPQEKPVSTFPSSEYAEKPKPSNLGKNPIVDADQLDAHIAYVLDNGFGWSTTSCLVLLVFALAAIWGNYPDDERRTVESDAELDLYPRQRVTLAVPDHRMRESLMYITMAQKRMSTAYLDDSLLGVYNIEPIPGWKMFRTASMMWEAYNLKHSDGKTHRPKQEESLEQRLYWTCLKSEWIPSSEVRHELNGLPSCTLQESSFPYSLPTFPTIESFDQSPVDMHQESSIVHSTTMSYYYYLAEISLRRLLNRTRSAATVLSSTIDSLTASQFADTLQKLEGQLQQWLDCLPPALRFRIPPDSLPSPDEPELVKLMRERYAEVRELLCRAYLYMCLHGGMRLTRSQAETFGAHASMGLKLSIYRIQTENPFFRHPGSWGASRVRFNHALCLIAAFRGKQAGIESAAHVIIPPMWRECVNMVQKRLEVWSDQGGGIRELATLLDWTMKL